MLLEELIYTRLATRAALTSRLAQFGTAPAIFLQSPPGDQADNWAGRTQYPRIDYSVEMQADPERHTSGQLVLNVWCGEGMTPPEEIEPEIRQALNDVFLTPAAGTPFSLTWQRSDTFEARAVAVKGAGVRGVTIIFDVWAFTAQNTHGPDPIQTINAWTKAQTPGAMVIGIDALPAQFMPTATQPVIYYRLLGVSVDRHAGAVTWLHADIAGHIIIPATEQRLQVLRQIADGLAVQKCIKMQDNSPMSILSLKADSSNNHLTTGQLRIRVKFGVLQPAAQFDTLRRAVASGAISQEVR